MLEEARQIFIGWGSFYCLNERNCIDTNLMKLVIQNSKDIWKAFGIYQVKKISIINESLVLAYKPT